MVHRQTLKALGLRAVGTANWLEHWSNRLREKMEKQQIDAFPRDPIDDNALTVTLTRGEVRQLLREMWEQISEIRKFSN
jgi:hypothetical protein